MRLLLLAALTIGMPAIAPAHDLTASHEVSGSLVVVRAAYDGGDPAANSDVFVYRPGDSEQLFQTGRSDLNGVFAFAPDTAGEWRVRIDDGFGHSVEHTVQTTAAGGIESPAAAAPTRWRDALTGVSLLVGLTGIWLWRRSRV